MVARINGSFVETPANKIRRSRWDDRLSILQFPEDLGVHGIVFNFLSYQSRSSAPINTINYRSSIVLPIPVNLQDSFAVDVNQTELGLLGAAAANYASQARSGENAASNFYNDVRKQVDDIVSNISEGGLAQTGRGALSGAQLLLRQGLATIDTGVARGIDVAQGQVVNPHVALTFEGVGLKNHTFNWILAPKTKTESEQLRKIIEEIKYRIHPQYGDSELGLGKAFLQYPDLVDVFFLGTSPSFLYKFKRAMVSNFSVNYTPNGPAFMEDGNPAAVQISMEIKEASIHTRDDYVQQSDAVEPAP